MCVYSCDRALTSDFEFLLVALSNHPLEKVRKLILRHVLVGSGVTSEVGPLLRLDIGHVGVRLGPLVLLLEPALFCGVASAFAIGTFLFFLVCGLGLLGLILIGFVITRRATSGYCHAPTRPLWLFWLINMFFVDHAKFQTKHALFLVLSGRGVTWSDLPAP